MTPDLIALVIGFAVMAAILLPGRKCVPAKRKIKRMYTSNGYGPRKWF